MHTEVHFADIRQQILSVLEQSTQSVVLAVSWFTDQVLFRKLASLANNGVRVELLTIDNHINRKSGIDFEQLTDAGGNLFWVSEAAAGSMKDMFCVVDDGILITGSYNWTNFAQSAHESITITWEHPTLTASFAEEFQWLKVLFHDQQALHKYDQAVIMRRLNVILNLLQLGEFDDIGVHVGKVRSFQRPASISAVLQLLERGEYGEAEQAIQDILARIQTIVLFEDPAIDRLRWEIRYLESRVLSLENEKSTIAKVVSEFVHHYTLAVGELLLRLLRLKAERLKHRGKTADAEKLRNAEEAYQQQRQHYEAEKKQARPDLNADEKAELERLKRKGSLMCHPDKFPHDEEKRAKAEAVFKQLMQAYEANDLDRLREIVANLEAGRFEIGDDLPPMTREKLEQIVAALRAKLQELEHEVAGLQSNQHYRQAVGITDLDAYLEREKERIQQEINEIEHEQHQSTESK